MVLCPSTGMLAVVRVVGVSSGSYIIVSAARRTLAVNPGSPLMPQDWKRTESSCLHTIGPRDLITLTKQPENGLFAPPARQRSRDGSDRARVKKWLPHPTSNVTPTRQSGKKWGPKTGITKLQSYHAASAGTPNGRLHPAPNWSPQLFISCPQQIFSPARSRGSSL